MASKKERLPQARIKNRINQDAREYNEGRRGAHQWIYATVN